MKSIKIIAVVAFSACTTYAQSISTNQISSIELWDTNSITCELWDTNSITWATTLEVTVWPRNAAKSPAPIEFYGLTNNSIELKIQYLYDFTTNWVTTNAIEEQTLLRTNSWIVPDPHPPGTSATDLVFYGHTETQLIYSIKRVEYQRGDITSNVFLLVDFKGHANRYQQESTPMPLPAFQAVTNIAETPPKMSFNW